MLRICVWAAAMSALACLNAAAADWPTEPTDIRLIIGNEAGGGSDISARTLLAFLAKHLGDNATIVPINKPGAGGEIAFGEVAQAAPDGRTIGLSSMPNLVSRLAEDAKTSFDLDDFTYIGNFATSSGSIVVPIDSPFKTMKDFLDYAKANPGKVTVAVGAVGNDDHLNILRVASKAGLDLKIIPFGGGAGARTAVMGGQVDVATMSALEANGYLDALRILAVSSAERAEFAPDVPTFLELGIDLVGEASKGIIAPAGLPADITEAYGAALEAALKDPEFLEAAKKQRLTITYMGPADYAAYVKTQLEALSALFKSNPWK